MELKIKEVESRNELRLFIRFPDQLYKGCNYYVPPLHKQQFETLSADKNPAFDHCEARYWLAYQGDELVGRIAGIINHRYNEEQQVRQIRFGWFDFTDDERVAKALLTKVEAWGQQRNMTAIHGPLGFTSFDPSGVLVEGFEEWPFSFGRYNYAYYNDHLQNSGYTKDVDWLEYTVKVPDPVPERVIKLSKVVKKRFALRNAPIHTRKDIKEYAVPIFEMINTIYQGIYCFSTLTSKQIHALVKEFVALIHPDYVSVIVNEKNEPVAFGLAIHSLVKALKKAGGSLYPFGWLHLHRALKKNDTVDLLLIGVMPAYQNKGAHALVFEKMGQSFIKHHIKQLETTRELEHNRKVQQLWEGYEKRQHKRARCYIKSL